jgi:hypothetical protein
MAATKVVRATVETTGIGWYRIDVNLEDGSARDEHSWPEMDNTDTEIVKVELSDGRTFDLKDPGEREAFQQTGIEIDDELYDRVMELSWEAQPL